MRRIPLRGATIVFVLGLAACNDGLGGACREYDESWSDVQIQQDTTEAWQALRSLSSTQPMVESLHPWGAPSIVGELSIPLDTLGCAGPDAEAAAWCVLEKHGAALGIRDIDAELEFSMVLTISGGPMVRFASRYAGYPVDWSWNLGVRFDAQVTEIRGLNNDFRPNLRVTNQVGGCLGDAFDAFDLGLAMAAAADACGRAPSSVGRIADDREEDFVFTVDAETNDHRAARRTLMSGLELGNDPGACGLCGCYAEVDVVSYEVLRIWPSCSY